MSKKSSSNVKNGLENPLKLLKNQFEISLCLKMSSLESNSLFYESVMRKTSWNSKLCRPTFR